jgi:ubiquinone/menaquinone biosynthesis C-methylase UbiE
MKWYDLFSNFYDSTLEKLYADSRRRAVEIMDPGDGQKILDVACGTGANFRHILKANSSVTIYGTDYSEGMLRKAAVNAEKNAWEQVRLFRSDARDLNPATLAAQKVNTTSFDIVICVLGLSVVPEWQKVLDNMLGLLKDKGMIVIVDVFSEKRTFNTWLVEKIAKADLDRNIWQSIQKKTDNFHLEYLLVKESKVGGKLFVCSGMKRS